MKPHTLMCLAMSSRLVACACVGQLCRSYQILEGKPASSQTFGTAAHKVRLSTVARPTRGGAIVQSFA